MELLVRANRVPGKDDADKLKVNPAQSKLTIDVKRLSACVKAGKAGREGRSTDPPGHAA